MRAKCVRPRGVIVLALAVALGYVGRADAVSLSIGSANGTPGSTAQIQVKMSAPGEQVAGVMNDLSFEPAAPIVGCRLGEAFAGDPLSTVVLQPKGCTPGRDCTRVRALALKFGGTIPDGSLLYTCDVKVGSSTAAGDYPLTCSSASASSSTGALTTKCTSGVIKVSSTAGGSAGSSGGSRNAGGCSMARGQRSAAHLAWLALLPLAGLLRHRRPRG
jgi:hypothetical protein